MSALLTFSESIDRLNPVQSRRSVVTGYQKVGIFAETGMEMGRVLRMAKTVSGTPEIERLFPTLEALAAAGGVSVLLILAALRNPAIWEVIGGGPGGGIDPRTISAEAKQELHSALTDILSGVMSKAKQGDIAAALIASQIALQRAAFR